MDYFSILQLSKEPFTNTPDPDAFYESRQHLGCLQKLELAARLKRGLNVVIGDVGTGKTTLCRELIRRLDGDPLVETHLILDPAFDTAADFLSVAHAMLCDAAVEGGAGERHIKERIKQTLFEKGVTRNRTVVLIIDEGQKLQAAVMEILRELLNYETNQFKLLQIVIFAQGEFETVLRNQPNFADRINLLQHLTPLGFGDTRRLIHHRVRQAGSAARTKPLFTLPAMWAIYRATRGYPRKIIHLCHQCTLGLIIQNRTRAGWRLVRACGRRMPLRPIVRPHPWRRIAVALPVSVVLLFVLFTVVPDRWLGPPNPSRSHVMTHPVAQHAETMPAANARETEDTTPTGSNPLPEAASESADRTGTAPPKDTPGEGVLAGGFKPAEPPKPTATATPSPENDPPRLLGHVAVQPGDTLFGLVQSIYGSNATRFTRAVIDANPQIENPNAIDLDDVIVFPAIPLPAPGGPTRHWIVMESHDALADALKRRHALRREAAAPMRILPHWSAAEGLRFAIAADRSFTNHQAAVDYAETFPEPITQTVRIQSGWPEGTRIYALPIRSLQDG